LLKFYEISVSKIKSITGFFSCKLKLNEKFIISLFEDPWQWCTLWKNIILYIVFKSFSLKKLLFVVGAFQRLVCTKVLFFMNSGEKNWLRKGGKFISFLSGNVRVIWSKCQIDFSGFEILPSCLHMNLYFWNKDFLIIWYYEISLIIERIS